MLEPDPLTEALDTTGLSVAGLCGPTGAPLSAKGRAEAARLIYEVARLFDGDTGSTDGRSHTGERGAVDDI